MVEAELEVEVEVCVDVGMKLDFSLSKDFNVFGGEVLVGDSVA